MASDSEVPCSGEDQSVSALWSSVHTDLGVGKCSPFLPLLKSSGHLQEHILPYIYLECFCSASNAFVVHNKFYFGRVENLIILTVQVFSRHVGENIYVKYFCNVNYIFPLACSLISEIFQFDF